MTDDPARPVASAQDGRHPRPQLVRTCWADLSGPWQFAFDDADRGLQERWWRDWPDGGTSIVVPYPPESPASGIGDPGFHRVSWYRRTVSPETIAATGRSPEDRVMLRFGAVDYRCSVWVDGQLVGGHEGGHTPFSLDVTDALDTAVDEHVLVVRTEDDPHDVAQPRGKQDWREHPHVVWYDRTSGIWQPVWLEAVPPVAVEWVRWTTEPRAGTVTAEIRLSAPPTDPTPVRVALAHRGTILTEASTTTTDADVNVILTIPALRNGQGYEELLWSPDHPRLVDALIDVGADRVSSYFGIRTVGVAQGRFLLNDRPVFLQSVLSQGYWPQSHLAAPSPEALRAEVELIKNLGFNATRVHQKFEDPRFLYWADRLGLLVWAEAPATFTYSAVSIERTVREWLEIIRRDYSHPSIVTWVPLNESWGVQHIAHDSRMQDFARALVALTKALDSTRPVVSNDGWEQVDTDIVAIHDYEVDPAVLAGRYRDRAGVDSLMSGIGPAGRTLVLSGDVDGVPIMLTEFGGVSYNVHSLDDAWGYSAAATPDDFAKRIRDFFDAVRSSTVLAGFCYTQLSDTRQEINGLVDAGRMPKIPIDRLRAMVNGEPEV